METAVWILLLILALLAGMLTTWLVMRRTRLRHLHHRFGSDYDRPLRAVSAPLRVPPGPEVPDGRSSTFTVQPLGPVDKVHAATLWQSIQALFVDQPERAVEKAEELISEVMLLRGFPSGDFEQLAENLSADHPRLLENYRATHAITLRRKQGEATTEDLRRALLYYRSILDDLVEDSFARRIQVRR